MIYPRPAYNITLDNGRVVRVESFDYDPRRDSDHYVSPKDWEQLERDKYEPDYVEIPF